VAHDLSEPLRTISVYAQMLKTLEKGEPDPTASSYLDFIRDAAVRMRAFMDGLLDYSQASAVQSESMEIDCEALMERVTANLDGAIRESEARVAHKGLPVVHADGRIEYVFQNLLSNAIKYRRSGVTPEICVSAKQDGDFWVFAVKDNGIGIEAEYLNSIFDVFRRLHGHDIPGNGIGLALCRKIIQGQGGMIWAESQPDAGATFYFTLPVNPALA
jgi:light-regulated signal transduction histidine kinase (bacteriophytochrome)